MPIQYVKGSFKKVADKIVQFEIKNTEGSAKVNVSTSVLLDSQDVTGGSSISIKGGKFSKIKENMDLDLLYGDSMILKSELKKPIESGSHSVRIEIKVNWPMWTTFVLEFKAKLT